MKCQLGTFGTQQSGAIQCVFQYTFKTNNRNVGFESRSFIDNRPGPISAVLPLALSSHFVEFSRLCSLPDTQKAINSFAFHCRHAHCKAAHSSF